MPPEQNRPPDFDQALEHVTRRARRRTQRLGFIVLGVGLAISGVAGLVVGEWLVVAIGAGLTVIGALVALSRPPRVDPRLLALRSKRPDAWCWSSSHGLVAVVEGRLVGGGLSRTEVRRADYDERRHVLRLELEPSQTHAATEVVALGRRTSREQAQAVISALDVAGTPRRQRP